MSKPVDTVTLILLNALRDSLQIFCGKHIRSNRIKDPVAFEVFRSRAIAALFYGVLGIAVERIDVKQTFSNDTNASRSLREWDLLRLGTRIPLHGDLESLAPQFRSIIERAWKDVSEVEIVHLGQVEDIYEQVVAADFEVTDGKMSWKIAHEGRNRQGAFFTPDDLAAQCARVAIDRLVLQHTGVAGVSRQFTELNAVQRQRVYEALITITAADYSCGVGRFLRAYLKEALKLARFLVGEGGESYRTLDRTIVTRLRGIDVDYVALEIAKLTLLSDINAFDIYGQITTLFVFGNPLIHRPEKASFDVSRAAFQAGFLYSLDLGLNLYTDVVPADVILGNPPWERIRLEERSFFFSLDAEIASCIKKSGRQRLIAKLSKTAPALYAYYCEARDTYIQAKALICDHPYFLHSARGELNTYALFTELAINKIAQKGVIGLLVKTGLVATVVNQRIFRRITERQLLVSIGDFVNRGRIFAIDSRERFCYLLLGDNKTQSFKYGGLFTSANELGDATRYWDFPFAALNMLNVDTGMLPGLTDADDLKFLLSLHERNPLLKDIYPDAKFGRLVHLTNHADAIKATGGANYIAVYEGKFIEQYDGRFATFDGIPEKKRHTAKARARLLTLSERGNRYVTPVARHYVSISQWLALTREYTGMYSLMWRSLTSATNRRTCIATILPHQPTSQSIQFLQLREAQSLALLLATVNSTTFDYIIRRKLSGIDLTQTIMKQTPVPHPKVLNRNLAIAGVDGSLEDHLLARVCSLLSDDARLDQFRELVHPKIRIKETDRTIIQSELDMLVARGYGITAAEYERILNGFKDLEGSNLENRNSLLDRFKEYPIVQH